MALPKRRVTTVVDKTFGNGFLNVPEFAESYYVVRHPDPRVTLDLFDRVVKAAEGAAIGTGTTMDYELISGTYSTLPNDVLGRAMDANLHRVGAPKWTADEMSFAERLRKNLPGKNEPLRAFPRFDVALLDKQLVDPRPLRLAHLE